MVQGAVDGTGSERKVGSIGLDRLDPKAIDGVYDPRLDGVNARDMILLAGQAIFVTW